MNRRPSSLVLLIIGGLLGFILGRHANSREGDLPPAPAAPDVPDAPRLQAPTSAGNPTPATAPPLPPDRWEMDRLVMQNEELKRALGNAKQAERKALETASLHALISTRLIPDGESRPRDPVATALLRAGQLNRMAAEFKARYHGRIPADNSPEFGEYARRLAELADEYAPVLRALAGDNGARDLVSKPDSAASMQALILAGALRLDDDQFQRVYSSLTRHYRDGFAQGLNLDALPAAGVETWEQRRMALNDQAVAEIKMHLGPEQRAAFDTTFGKTLMWKFSLGDGL